MSESAAALRNFGGEGMEDEEIIALYWQRSEDAIYETNAKYGRLCRSIAYNVLGSREDCEECVNDAYFAVWNAIPEQRPARFAAFLGRITRNLALKRYEYLTAEKRNPAAAVSLSELSDCVSGREGPEDAAEARRVEAAISRFLSALEEHKRVVFLRRYWYFDSIQSISDKTGFSHGKVKSMLHQTRRRLREYLESEGIDV